MKELISPLAEQLRKREVSSLELTKEYINKIENDTSNAFCHTDFEKALKGAEAADKLIKNGYTSLLCGIPTAVKDNICTRGDLTCCASKILSNYRPFYSATVWERLEKNGAVLLGKTNMDEFAMGSSSETGIYGAVKNPDNPSYSAGGSSGGSAAAVKAGLIPYALGSDTGGSVRQPAAFCGIVGLKPTYGAVSRYGLIAHASSLDQIGVLANSVKDAAVVFEAISGKDEHDSTSIDTSFEGLSKSLNTDVNALKIGVVTELFEGVSEEVKIAVFEAIQRFELDGAEIYRIELPIIKKALPAYYIISCAEASSNLGRYDGIRYGYKAKDCADTEEMIIKTRSEGFGTEVKRRIMLGTYVLSSGYYDKYYIKAKKLREMLTEEFENVFKKCDVIIAPTAPDTAFKFGLKRSPVEIYRADISTVPINIAGLPAISIPVGTGKNGLSIGMQIIGRRFGEKDILNAAYFYEKRCANEL